MIKKAKWRTLHLNLEEKAKIIKITSGDDYEPYAVYSKWETKTEAKNVNGKIIIFQESFEKLLTCHTEIFFSSEETRKFRIRSRSKRDLLAEEIEEFLKKDIETLNYEYRGAIKSKKFGL